MTTSYSSIIEKFDDNLSEQEKTNLNPDIENQYLRNAISFYISTVSLVHFDHTSEQIEEDLTEVEKNLLGLLMYDLYLDKEIIKYNRIINISNEFVKTTGAIDRVKTLKDMKVFNQEKINQILSGMI